MLDSCPSARRLPRHLYTYGRKLRSHAVVAVTRSAPLIYMLSLLALASVAADSGCDLAGRLNLREPNETKWDNEKVRPCRLLARPQLLTCRPVRRAA